MTARLFRCNIVNAGGAPIFWVRDHLDHGEWADESLPSQAAGRIDPGQTGHYQAESGGDIPLLSSLMTGTEGWVAFRTTNLSGTSEWFKVTHWLPYWAPRRGAAVEVMRFDPTLTPGSTEFDTADKSPPTISVERQGFSPHADDLAEVQSLPWYAFWSVAQIFTVPHSDFHWHLTIKVSATAPAPSTTIPFPTTPPPDVKSSGYRFSSPELWRGAWESDDGDVVVGITARDDGLLDVRVRERDTGLEFENEGVAISRNRFLDPLQVIKLLPELNVELSYEDRLMLEVMDLGGEEYDKAEVVTRDHRFLGELVAELGPSIVRDLAVGVRPRPEKFGGDFLRLDNDAVIEIHQLKAEGAPVGHELRYLRPGFVPVFVALGIDRRLHRFVKLN